MWIEKYKPKHFDQIIESDNIKDIFKNKNIKSLFHIIFYGDNGIAARGTKK